jgi:hypothetical protein
MNSSKIALVSRDLSRLPDYAPHLSTIADACESWGVDTILYSLWSCDRSVGKEITGEQVFGRTKSVEAVILESCYLPSKGACQTLVWRRRDPQPRILRQRFARSSESQQRKHDLIRDFDDRKLGKHLVLLCGESNIVRIPASGGVADDFGFLRKLRDDDVGVILNPIHDFMKRHEMKKKRAALSLEGRWVVSVWNKGKKGETYMPWTVFHNGSDLTHSVREVPVQIPSVRIGIVNVT